MRGRWAAWRWPLLTFAVIGAFLVLTIVVRDWPQGAPAGRQITLGPLDPPAHLTTRDWRAVAADATGHAGERVVIWGQVTSYQPEAASFRADVDAARHTPQDGTVHYPTPAVLRGEPYLLRPLTSGCVFTAQATIEGTTPPGTPGGVPLLTVTRVTVTDRTPG